MTKLYLAVAFSTLLIITGCSEKTSDEYIAQAETKIQQDDIPSAIIDLKNAIEVNPRDAKSRFMLGELYAQRGSSAAAEKELKRALELNYEPNEVLPLLANVYNLQFKHAEIIELVESSRNLSPEVSTSLLLYKALAHFQLGEPYKAKKAVADANEISADSLYSKLGSAYVDFSNNQIDVSLEKINQILTEHPEFADAHLLKGQLSTAANDPASAVESFKKYRTLLPRTFQSKVLLANAYFKNRDYQQAENEVDLLLQFNPDQPFVNQLKGAIRFQAEDFEAAKTHMEKAIQNGFDSVPNKSIAGISAFKLGFNELAYDYFSSVKSTLRAEHPILKMIAILELKLGKGQEAGDTLTSMDGLTEDDVILLSAASAQLMSEGNPAQVEAMLNKVKGIDFNNPLRIAQKGMLRLSLNDIDGLVDLEKALSLSPDQNDINSALAKAYIDNGLYDKALELSEKWIAQEDKKVFGYSLAGVSYLQRNKTELAEQMFAEAIKLEPSNIAANIYYANKAQKTGNEDLALTYLSTVLAEYPDHRPTLRKHFVLQTQKGNEKDGLRPIESAFNANTSNFELRMLFAKALFSSEKFNECIGVLEYIESKANLPNNYWIVLGNAYYSVDKRQKALNLTQQWIATQPSNKSARLRMIALQDLFRNYDQALEVVTTAKLDFPDDDQFNLLAIFFNLVKGNIEIAEEYFDDLPVNVKNSVAGEGMLGQILLEKGKAEQALPKLKMFYQQRANQRNVALVAKAYKALGSYKQAMDVLEEYKAIVGESISTDVQIAELAIVSGNNDLAIEKYKKILDAEPINSRALNNLAYLLLQQGQNSEALRYTERAVMHSPENSAIQDTYGTALFKNGEINKAVKVFEKLYKSNEKDVGVALRYAEALISDKNYKMAEKVLRSVDTRAGLDAQDEKQLSLLLKQV